MKRSRLMRLLGLGVAIVVAGTVLEWFYYDVLLGTGTSNSWFVCIVLEILDWIVAKPTLTLPTVVFVGCVAVRALIFL
ncbi:MAG: hypothetical protein FWD59_05100, partial [Micrococcales bacterium]|nr:hypothetical protein [Micrococcales bacterium]